MEQMRICRMSISSKFPSLLGIRKWERNQGPLYNFSVHSSPEKREREEEVAEEVKEEERE